MRLFDRQAFASGNLMYQERALKFLAKCRSLVPHHLQDLLACIVAGKLPGNRRLPFGDNLAPSLKCLGIDLCLEIRFMPRIRLAVLAEDRFPFRLLLVCVMHSMKRAACSEPLDHREPRVVEWHIRDVDGDHFIAMQRPLQFLYGNVLYRNTIFQSHTCRQSRRLTQG